MSVTTTLAPDRVPPTEHAGDPLGTGALLDAVDSPDEQLPCRLGDADLWFSEAPAELERAKGLCAECPVRAACLAGALERGEPWGVWGGEIFERGAIVARKRPRGRPRKNTRLNGLGAA